MHLVAATRIFGDDVEATLRVTHFADGRGAGEFIEQGAEALQKLQVFRLVLVVEMFLVIVWIDRRCDGGVALVLFKRRIVFQTGRMNIEIDRIQPEAVDTALEPEAHSVEQRILHVRIVEIEVGLAGQKIVQVILAAARVPLPGRAAEDRQPVVGRAAICFGSAQTYQSARGLVRFCRLSMNHGCWSEEWEITWSIMTLRPSRCASVIMASKSASEPNIGSTSL